MIESVVWFWTEYLPGFLHVAANVSAVVISIVLALGLAYYCVLRVHRCVGWLFAKWDNRNE